MDTSGLKRILYVEDDEDLQQVVRLCLEYKGKFTIKICNSGECALKEIEEFKPDLLLLDVVLEGMSGPSTLQRIRELPEVGNVPTIFLTSKIQKKQLELYKGLGALGVIRKPLNPINLNKQVMEIWNSQFNKKAPG